MKVIFKAPLDLYGMTGELSIHFSKKVDECIKSLIPDEQVNSKLFQISTNSLLIINYFDLIKSLNFIKT